MIDTNRDFQIFPPKVYFDFERQVECLWNDIEFFSSDFAPDLDEDCIF